MKNRNHSTLPAAATLFALLIGGAAATGTAQNPKPAPIKMPEHQQGTKGMKGMQGKPDMPGKQGMQGMNGMMGGPHQVLAMAYRDNLVTFAKALRGQVSPSKAVDTELARPAVIEMRRSFDQMRQHHQAHMATMSEHMDSSMIAMKGHMDTHMAALSEHLTALESDVNGSAPDARRISMHADEIVKECAGMSPMHAKAKSHKMR